MEGVLTTTEQKLINLAILCNPEGLASVKVDYDKLAERAGLKNAGVARVTFGKARRKLLAHAGEGNGNGNGSASPTKMGSSPNKIVKKTAAGGNGSPAKPRGRKNKVVENESVPEEPVAAVKTEVAVEETEEEGIAVDSDLKGEENDEA